MAFVDSEALVRGVVATAVTPVKVATKVPSTRPPEFIWVRRTGGPVMGRVVDQPQMTVTAWAATSIRALELANLARQALIDAAKGANGVHRVQMNSLYYDPDPDSGGDRYTFTAFLNVRATRS